jgi:hypothetical protein
LIKIISVNKVTEIETVLSADDMQGRRAFTPGLIRHQHILSRCSRKLAWKPLTVLDYKQEFAMTESKERKVQIDGLIDKVL